jgi:amidase
MSTGSVRPLDDAYRISQHDLVGWTGELLVLDPLDALQLVGQTGLAPVANMVAPNYTMVAKLPRWTLGGTQAYDGLHGRRRQAAAEHLAQRT